MSDNPTFQNIGASVSDTTASTAHGAAMVPGVQTAIDLAIQLDQLRQVYGEGCFLFVTRELRASGAFDWEAAMLTAVEQWLTSHPRVVLDLDFVR